jgi:hypothetical protein
VDHRRVRRWEEGECAPDICHQEVICELLEVPWEERDQLGFVVSERKQVSPEIESAATVTPRLLIVTDQYTGLDAKATHPDPSSSEQLQLGEACVIEHPAIVASNSGIGLTVALNGSSRLDPELLSDLEALVKIYRRMDRKLGAPVIIDDLMSHFKRLSMLKNLSATSDTTQRLAAHAADVATLVAWQLLDMGRVDEAWGYYRSARDAAHEAGDAELQAFVLAQMSYVPLLAGYVREASTLVGHAERLSQGLVSPTFRAWLAGVEAEISSMSSDEVASLKMLERAAVVLDSAASEESPLPSISYFDISHLIRWQGQCPAQLHKGQEAQTILEQALAIVSPSFVRARSGMSLDLASSYLQQDGLEPACDMARQGLMLARATQSVRYRQRVIVFRAQLEPWTNDPAVQRLDRELWCPTEC